MESFLDNHYYVFIFWDCYIKNNKHAKIKCLFAEIPEEDFKNLDTKDSFWYLSLNKKYYKVFERNLHYVLNQKPGNIIHNNKDKTKYFDSKFNYLKKVTLDNFDFSNSVKLNLNTWLSNIKGKPINYRFKEFQNSIFHIYNVQNKDFDYLVIPATEIFKRFYLYTTKLCKKIDDFGLYYDDPVSNPVFDKTKSTINKEKTEIYIHLNKYAEHNFHGVWARFFWNDLLGKNIRNLFNKIIENTINEIDSSLIIDLEWPEQRIIKQSTFEGRIWNDPISGKNFYIVTEIRIVENEPEWKKVKITYKPSNDNEQIPESKPAVKKRKIETPVEDKETKNIEEKEDKKVSKVEDSKVPTSNSHGRSSVQRKITGREYLLYDSVIGVKEQKKEQKTHYITENINKSHDEITDGEEDSDSENAGVDYNNNDNSNKNKSKKNNKEENQQDKKEPLKEKVPYPIYWSKLDELFNLFEKDENITVILKKSKIKIIDKLSSIKKIIKFEENENITKNINQFKLYKNNLTDLEYFVQRSIYLNSKTEKKIRTLWTIQFEYKNKKIQFIEFEPLSTGSTSYIVIDNTIKLSKIKKIYIKHKGDRGKIKEELNTNKNIRIIFKNHPTHKEKFYVKKWKKDIVEAFFTSSKST